MEDKFHYHFLQVGLFHEMGKYFDINVKSQLNGETLKAHFEKREQV